MIFPCFIRWAEKDSQLQRIRQHSCPTLKRGRKKKLVNSLARWIYFPHLPAAVVKPRRQKCVTAETKPKTKPKTMSLVHDTNVLCWEMSHTCIHVRNHLLASVTESLGGIKDVAWDSLTVLLNGESIGDSNRS